MRKTINTEEIKPGIKAFLWEGFCLEKDQIRRKYIEGYDPLKLNEEVDKMDWFEFQWKYENEYCDKIAYLREEGQFEELKDWQRNCDPQADLMI